MKVFDFEQGTNEWKNIRKGIITGTKAKDVFSCNNLKLVDFLISEVTSDFEESDYESNSMIWGKSQEFQARVEYELKTFNKVVQHGFCISEAHDFLGISPDGFIVDKNGNYVGGLEIKCLDGKNHCEFIRMNTIPAKYRQQVNHYFIVNDKIEWVDFVSYEPRNKLIKLFVVRVKRVEIQDVLKENMDGFLKFRNKWLKYHKEFVDKSENAI